jgi:hypothetical protein
MQQGGSIVMCDIQFQQPLRKATTGTQRMKSEVRVGNHTLLCDIQFQKPLHCSTIITGKRHLQQLVASTGRPNHPIVRAPIYDKEQETTNTIQVMNNNRNGFSLVKGKIITK